MSYIRRKGRPVCRRKPRSNKTLLRTQTVGSSVYLDAGGSHSQRRAQQLLTERSAAFSHDTNRRVKGVAADRVSLSDFDFCAQNDFVSDPRMSVSLSTDTPSRVS